MTIYVDIVSRKIISSPRLKRDVSRIEVKRGDLIPFSIIFIQNGEPVSLGANHTVTLGAKLKNNNEGVAMVLQIFTQVGAAIPYTANVNFNGSALREYLNNAVNVIDDYTYVDLQMEINWINTSTTLNRTTNSTILRVYNDVIQGGETAPVVNDGVPFQFLDGIKTNSIQGLTSGDTVVFSAPITTTGASSHIQTSNAGAAIKSTNFAAVEGSGASLVDGSFQPCLTWSAGGRNLTIPAGTAVTFNSTNFTFGTGSASAFVTALGTYNASTATALQTSRNIFGLSFNGTANVTGNAESTGSFASIPIGGAAGHFITLNGTAPTVIAGRSAWWTDTSGVPSFRNGTEGIVTLLRSSDASTSTDPNTVVQRDSDGAIFLSSPLYEGVTLNVSSSGDNGAQAIQAVATGTSGVGGNFISTSGRAIIATSDSSTALEVRSKDGTYHATFGTSGNNRSAIERVRGWFVWFYANFTGRLKTANITADRDWTLPDATGTIALTASATGVPDKLTNGTIAGTLTINSINYTYGAEAAVAHVTALGLPATGNIVTLTGTQVLTNKTLTAPTINSATIGTAVTFNAMTYTYGSGAAVAHVAALNLPATGNIVTLTGSQVLTNKTLTTPVIAAINGGIAANDDITIQGTTNVTRETSYVSLQPNGGSVGIGNASPDASALLDMTSITQGFLPPRMTSTERDSISSPADGLIIFNITTSKINYYNGTHWHAVSSSNV
jgi:hypothetical protein